jgi:hypothetical protein
VNANLKGVVFSTLLTTGSDDGEQTETESVDVKVPKDSIWENHFEDSEKMTTVTVIEDFDQIGLETDATKSTPTEDKKVYSKTSSTQPKSHPDKKKKAFRYGTKAERQSDRNKAKAKKQTHSNHREKKRK